MKMCPRLRTHSTCSERSHGKDLEYSLIRKSQINLFHRKVMYWLAAHLPLSSCLPQVTAPPHTATCHVWASLPGPALLGFPMEWAV